MTVKMPNNISISLDDIHEVEKGFGCDFSDEYRCKALLRTTNMDVQACPGSGKTTLLVAKLAILSRKWKWRDRGICVLSHTNVAREQVETRLARHPYGHKLLSYPHYTGTIQNFVDSFLAIPYLRSKGMEVARIDNNHFANIAESYADANQRHFYWFRQSRNQRMGFLKKARFEFVNGSLEIGCADKNFNLSRTTSSYSAMKDMKDRLAQKGLFRFDDMFAYAQKYVFDHPTVLNGLRHRFPWVFVDEMQDTTDVADALIMRLFEDGCILQRFGDANQAIYHGEGDEKRQKSFPDKKACVDLPMSKRFGPAIAHLCSPLTIEAQIIEGSSKRQDRANTMMLFDSQTIGKVLPTFGEIVAVELGHISENDLTVKAVGFRKKPRSSQHRHNLPHDIGDYWQGFDSTLSKRSGDETRLLHFIIKARSILATKRECQDPYSVIVDGLVRLSERLKLFDREGNRITKTVLLHVIRLSPANIRKSFDSFMRDLCMEQMPLDRENWGSIIENVLVLLCELFPGNKNAEADFLEWDPDYETSYDSKESTKSGNRNVYRFSSNDRVYDIEVTTIHDVKGQTHDATLLLETFFSKSHDIRKVLSYLMSDSNCCANADGPAQEHLKRTYVAMTRPRELLCVALLKDHLGSSQKSIEDTWKKLEARGWRILDLIGISGQS
jgi:DNA helicase-2/ATP-dependent DNA helicase PcrA